MYVKFNNYSEWVEFCKCHEMFSSDHKPPAVNPEEYPCIMIDAPGFAEDTFEFIYRRDLE